MLASRVQEIAIVSKERNLTRSLWMNCDTDLDTGEQLDQKYCDLQIKEAELRRKIFEDTLTTEQYVSLQALLDDVGSQIANILKKIQYGEIHDFD